MHRILLAVALALAGCTTPGPAPDLEPVQADELQALKDDADAAGLRHALEQSRRWAAAQPAARQLHLGTRTFTAGDLQRALAAWSASVPTTAAASDLVRTLPQFFEAFRVVPKENTDGALLVTGYYVPVVDGSLGLGPSCNVPVLPVPDDLVIARLDDFDIQGKPAKLRGRIDGHRFVPYYDRAAIRAGALAKTKTQPIAWVKDELDLFVIEIQGSGVLRLPDGTRRIIGYAEENGRPYRPIGRLLLDEKKLAKDHLSMPAIRAYLKAHPEDLAHVLAYNPSFVFFHFTGNDVLGNLGQPLTAGRSVATDQKVIPPGVPVFIDVPKPKLNPDGTVANDGAIAHVAFNQDTGGAIRGDGHVDYFCGEGDDAEAQAGIMKQRGALMVFVPRPPAQAH